MSTRVQYRWQCAPAQPELARLLARELAVTPILAQCLANRGLGEVSEARLFLEPRLKNLSDPFLLPGMNCAVERLIQARERGESIILFGDYDVDGITATALLKEALETLGCRTCCYLPDRFGSGYGLTNDSAESCLKAHQGTILMAVDCGSSAVETIAKLQGQGLDVIVLDHHLPGGCWPPALAVINPKVEGPHPSFLTDLCSVGLAFKLVHGLVKELRRRECPLALSLDVRTLLDLVALGTIADLVPLRHENRILAAVGLQRLALWNRPGLKALKEVAGMAGEVGVYEVGFQLAPRLNAAGRLADAEAALNLLLSRRYDECLPLAQTLEARNRERQSIERGVVDELLKKLRPSFRPEEDFVIVEGSPDWHIGVVGIVASRVLQEFYRPTLILGGAGGEWRGSGRSIAGFDLAAALEGCDDLFVRHGGHAMAAGVTMLPENLEAVRGRLNQLARDSLTEELLQPCLGVDAQVSLGEITDVAVRELDKLQPAGVGNRTIQVLVQNLRLAGPPRLLGKEQQHLKAMVTDGTRQVPALWWNHTSLPPEPFDLVCVPELNEFNGRETVQLNIRDARSSSGQPLEVLREEAASILK